MPHIGLAELLGVKGKSIQWERPLWFCGALFVSDLVARICDAVNSVPRILPAAASTPGA